MVKRPVELTAKAKLTTLDTQNALLMVLNVSWLREADAVFNCLIRSGMAAQN